MPDFFASAQRHLADGDLLETHSRAPNAVQLWGYGAECVLKFVASKQGHFTLSPAGKPTNGFDLHVNQQRSGQTLLSLYNALQSGTAALSGPASAFADWKVDARYEDGTQLNHISTYKADASVFRALLSAALKQGLLP